MKHQTINLTVTGSDEDSYLENLAETSQAAATAFVNKLTQEQRRYFCDCMMVAYLQAQGLQVVADRAKSKQGFWVYSDDTIRLVGSALRQIGIDFSVKAERRSK